MYSLIFAIFEWSICTTWEGVYVGVSFTRRLKKQQRKPFRRTLPRKWQVSVFLVSKKSLNISLILKQKQRVSVYDEKLKIEWIYNTQNKQVKHSRPKLKIGYLFNTQK